MSGLRGIALQSTMASVATDDVFNRPFRRSFVQQLSLPIGSVPFPHPATTARGAWVGDDAGVGAPKRGEVAAERAAHRVARAAERKLCDGDRSGSMAGFPGGLCVGR